MTQPPAGLSSRIALILAVLLAAGRFAPLNAARGETPAKASGFRGLLEQRQRETLRAVADYVAMNPQADDVEQACVWMFEAAGESGLEAEVASQAEQFLARRDLDPAVRQVAQSTLAMGLARGGKLPEAMAQFEAYLLAARFQSPFRALDLAGGLAAQARIAGNPGASRDIYERLAAAYPFKPEIAEIVEGRLARQALLGKPAPAISATDLQGKPFDLAGLAGQVVLIDFWATNCGPCLAEFPNLKQLYKDYGGRGFEIVGVSFDERPEIVETFNSRTKLPWRMLMNGESPATISERFSTQKIPALFVIDKTGTIAQVDVRGRDLRAVIEQLLK